MRLFIIVAVCAILFFVAMAQETQHEHLRIKSIQHRLEKASLKAVLNTPVVSLHEVGTMYPSGNYGAREGLKQPDTWPELILIAAFLNTECRNCNYREKKLVIEALRNRVEQDYDGFGNSYFEQIFARRYDKINGRWQIQFSGVGKPNKLKEWFFYRRSDRHSVANYKAAWEVIVEGERTLPCNVTNFIHVSTAVVEKEIERQAKNRYMPYENFYKGIKHRFAICKKIKCD